MVISMDRVSVQNVTAWHGPALLSLVAWEMCVFVSTLIFLKVFFFFRG